MDQIVSNLTRGWRKKTIVSVSSAEVNNLRLKYTQTLLAEAFKVFTSSPKFFTKNKQSKTPHSERSIQNVCEHGIRLIPHNYCS